MFVGSSSEGLSIAEALSERLKADAEVTIWNEGVFSLNYGYLEELISAVHQFDFAILVLTADDLIESRGESRQSPRDNVLFECGLFLGKLGRDRTFIVSANAKELKIPSDLAGVTLATYDAERMKTNAHAAVRGAYTRISKAIASSSYRRAYQLAGEWKSRYRSTVVEQKGLEEDDLVIKPSGGRIFIEKETPDPRRDPYKAYASLFRERHLVGEWASSLPTANAFGVFFLTVHPWGNILYGYFVGPDQTGATEHSTWVLARKEQPPPGMTPEGAARRVQELLDLGEKLIHATSPFLLSPSAALGGGERSARAKGSRDGAVLRDAAKDRQRLRAKSATRNGRRAADGSR